MRVLLARNSGFCFGVKRAVEMAQELADPTQTIYTYGHIIHNESVVNELRTLNIVPIETLDNLDSGSTLIIRAHGVPPKVYKICAQNDVKIVDATCPFVKRIHEIVHTASVQGRRILIAGEREHPEVIGICGYAGEGAIVLEKAEDAYSLPLMESITLVAQTTFLKNAFFELQRVLTSRCDDIEVFDTICDTTCARQTEAKAIAQNSTRVFVLGSRDSANTMRLKQLCSTYCKTALIIDSADKLFLDNLQSNDIIGIVAGASTPDRMIREVLQVMSELEMTTIETIDEEAPNEEIAVTKPIETTYDEEKNNIEEDGKEAETHANEIVENATAEPDAKVDIQENEAIEAEQADTENAVAMPEAAAGEEAELCCVEQDEVQPDDLPVIETVTGELMADDVKIAEENEEAPEETSFEVDLTEETDVTSESPDAKDEIAEQENVTPEAEDASLEKSVPDVAEPSEFEQAFEKTMTRIRNGQVIQGTVISIVDSEIFVNIGYKSDGVIPHGEFSSDPSARPEELFKEGDKIDVEITKVNDGEGNVLLSRKNVETKKIWDDLMDLEDIDSRIFEAVGKEVVKGGIIADIGGIRAFVPASQVSTKYIENLNDFVGQPMRLKVLEVDKQRKRIVASQKQVLLADAAAEKSKKWESLVVGSKVDGVVRRIADFGAFVDIGGIDGLVHVTDTAWGRVKHPSDVLSIGQEIEVLILHVDTEKERVSLGYKQLQPKPWALAESKYPVGTIVEGQVVRIVPFGAFVALESTIDGLIHISQVSIRRIAKVEDELKVGDIVRCKVLEVNQEAKRISLSRKEALLEENPELAEQLEAERAARDRQYAERQELRQQQRDQQQQQRVARDAVKAADRGDSGDHRDHSDRRRRNDDSDYELPPVQETTTSLAALFEGFQASESE